MLELSVGESDETGGDESFVVGQLLYAALIVAAAAARATDAGAARQSAATIAMSGLCHYRHTHRATDIAEKPSRQRTVRVNTKSRRRPTQARTEGGGGTKTPPNSQKYTKKVHTVCISKIQGSFVTL